MLFFFKGIVAPEVGTEVNFYQCCFMYIFLLEFSFFFLNNYLKMHLPQYDKKINMIDQKMAKETLKAFPVIS